MKETIVLSSPCFFKIIAGMVDDHQNQWLLRQSHEILNPAIHSKTGLKLAGNKAAFTPGRKMLSISS